MLKVKGDAMCATSDSQHWPFRCGGGGGTRWLNSGIELLLNLGIEVLFFSVHQFIFSEIDDTELDN